MAEKRVTVGKYIKSWKELQDRELQILRLKCAGNLLNIELLKAYSEAETKRLLDDLSNRYADLLKEILTT